MTYEQQTFILTVLEAGRSEIVALADVVKVRAWFIDGVFSLCLHMVEGLKDLSGSLL